LSISKGKLAVAAALFTPAETLADMHGKMAKPGPGLRVKSQPRVKQE
jgi:hypothetical protein